MNILYKLIVKILATRLKPLLCRFVSPYQSAFVAGRKITDSIILAKEIFHHKRSTKKGRKLLALKLDMSTAFDRVDWLFIEQVLQKMGLN